MTVPSLIGDGLRRNACKYPVKVAIKDAMRQTTYRELNDRVNQLANALLNTGIRRGDGVALLVGNRIEHLEILFALAKIGAVAIPLDIQWRALELASTLSSFQPVALFLEPSCRETLAQARELQELERVKSIVIDDSSYADLVQGAGPDEPRAEVGEKDPFAVMITSGTTGFPKACLASHRSTVFHCINNAIEKGLGVHDVSLLASPIYFNHGRSFSLATIYFGGTLIMHSHFDPAEVLKTIAAEKITYLGSVPTMCERLLRVQEVKKHDTRSLRCLSITGGRLHPTVLEGLRKWITPNIYRTYASTDSGQMAIAKPEDSDKKPLSAGRPVWCAELRIVDAQGKPLSVNDVGEIICRSPLAAEEYYKNPEATEAAFRAGWFHTGDLGYFDEEGYLYVVGREKDMVKSGGISIYPLEIESVLYSHPDVFEAAVIGVPDAEWGEAVKAIVVLKEGAVLRGEELIPFCRERLAAYKVPKTVDIVSSLPHTELGKVAKDKIKDTFRAQSAKEMDIGRRLR